MNYVLTRSEIRPLVSQRVRKKTYICTYKHPCVAIAHSCHGPISEKHMAGKEKKPDKEPGYVYILTNPSFREDWVKIGKSSRPVNVRSKELDNTAVPLPFEIGRVNRQVQYYEINLKNSFFGVEKLSFSLGLRLILYCISLMKSSESSRKSVPFGMYWRISLFPFSMAPFCHEAYESAK